MQDTKLKHVSSCDVLSEDYLDASLSNLTKGSEEDSIAIDDAKEAPVNTLNSCPVKFTETAILQIEKVISKFNLQLNYDNKVDNSATNDNSAERCAKDLAIGLRLGVKSGGCVGLKYAFECVSSKPEGDIPIELTKGLFIFVPPKSLLYIIGTTLDYKINSEDFSEAFVFINPNAKGTCGCGESFYV